MIARELTCHFSDQANRILLCRQAIHPTFEQQIRAAAEKIMMDDAIGDGASEYDRVARNLFRLKGHLKQTDEQTISLFARACAQYPDEFFYERDAFLNERERRIQTYIEDKCRNVARRIMDHGGRTCWSNAYNAGLKGVYWVPPQDSEVIYFTSIANGKTYDVENGHAMFVEGEILSTQPVEVWFSVGDVLPEGANPEADFEDFAFN